MFDSVLLRFIFLIKSIMNETQIVQSQYQHGESQRILKGEIEIAGAAALLLERVNAWAKKNISFTNFHKRENGK